MVFVKSQLDKFKLTLLELEKQSAHFAEQISGAAKAVELDQTKVGRLSRVDALQGQALAKASQQRQLADIANIRRALSRLENGNYGLCNECDEAIALARLKFDPTVTLCVQCAQAREH